MLNEKPRTIILTANYSETNTSFNSTSKKNKIDYEQRDTLFKRIGFKGECWVIKYEQERLKKLNIDFKIKHVSESNDSAGYDILSVEDDGITPRYIEVKTTTGGIDQPIYYTHNELEVSERFHEHYYIYRVYHFKQHDKKASLTILHGSLKHLNGQPISYKAQINP